jgi:hypothetical protein
MSTKKTALLLIGSAKPAGQSTSEALGSYLLQKLAADGFATTTNYIYRALRTPERRQALLAAVDQSALLILAFPLYVDTLPYLVINAMELIAAHRQTQRNPSPTRFVPIANCGFPEAHQNETALAICREFAHQGQLQWAGGLALGQGGALAGRSLTAVGGTARSVRHALDRAASALAAGQPVPPEAQALLAKPLMPAFFYTLMGNLGWLQQAHKQGSWGQLRAQPLTDPEEEQPCRP